MTDIELVIKIPEEDYEYLKSHNKNGLYNAILNGTPLPKGHGRLIDENDLRYFGVCTNPKFDEVDNLNEICSQDCVKCNHFAVNLSNAPTIIEADKEQEDGNDD